MATYNSIIDRSGASALIPEDAAREIIQGVPQQSAVLRLARRLPNMTRAQTRMPVLSGLVSAAFVTGDTGLKQTTNAAWANKYIDAEEIAAIVPIPENVLDDADYDIWGEIRPLIEEAIGAVIDAAILFDVGAPASWPDAVYTQIVAASHTVDHSSMAGDYYDELLGEGGVFAKVEADGYMVNGIAADVSMAAALRGLRTTDGVPIFLPDMRDQARYQLAGQPIEFVRNGSWNAATALMIAGDWTQLVYAIRQDITYKMLDQAVLQDGAGNIVYNLAQQDMVAMRVTMRLGWQVANPINRLNTNSTTRFPFAALVP